MLRKAQAPQALLLFGDEARFPQWGTLTDTWARRGQPPRVKTSGTRKGYKVFGLIDSFTGCFFDHGQEGRLNAAASIAFLTRVLARTTPPIFLMQDGATSHTSAETKAFFAQQTARLQVFQLPTYSPDYNPIEKLWKKIKQHETHLHYFSNFAAPTEKVKRRCSRLPIYRKKFSRLQPADQKPGCCGCRKIFLEYYISVSSSRIITWRISPDAWLIDIAT
jgi:transposase